MRDMEQTDELPALPAGVLRLAPLPLSAWQRRAAARALFASPLPSSVQRQLAATAALVTDLDRISKQPRSPLFQAALAMLRQEPDQLAVLCKLADSFPGATLTEVCQVLRETATLFAAAGVQPRGHS